VRRRIARAGSPSRLLEVERETHTENTEMNTSTQSNEQARAATAETAPSRPRRIFRPPVDVVENDGAYFLTVDLPGVAEDGIDVTVERNVLTLSARRADRTASDHRRLHGEIAHGDYRRTFTLPERVDRDAITATLRNGVLSLTVPKAAAALPRKISVRTAA
jgi:HSP20 family protein